MLLLEIMYRFTSILVIEKWIWNRGLKLWKEMAAHKIAHATYRGPSVVKEIVYGISIGLFVGGLWKMHQWNNQRRTREFYNLLEKGEISVVVEDE